MAKVVRIKFSGTGFQLMGWSLYNILLGLFIIPAAWGAVALSRWLIRNLSFDDGSDASFEGQGGQIWGYYALSMLIGYIPLLFEIKGNLETSVYYSYGFSILILPISAAIGLRIIRWFFSKIIFSDGTILNFTGSYGYYLGWSFLLSLSAFTIIGWAWVAVAFLQWICRKIGNESTSFEFLGNGWGLLWRCFLAGLASIFIIPIPWAWLWVLKWVITNLVITKTGKSPQIAYNQDAFFCFSNADAARAAIVIKQWETISNKRAGFISEAELESIEQNWAPSSNNWIDQQLKDTNVTIVLVGKETCNDQWIKYAIQKSIEKGNALFGIDISKIKDLQGNSSERCAQIPEGYPFYLWNKDNGPENIGQWIEAAVHKSPEVVPSKPPTAELIPKYCPGCGKPVEPGWLYCGYCHRELIQKELQSEPSENLTGRPPNDASAEPTDAKHGSNSIVRGILIGVIAASIVIVVNLAVLLQKNANDNKSYVGVSTVFSTATLITNPTQIAAPTEIIELLPTVNIEAIPVDEPIPSDELAGAEAIFKSGGAVYLYDPQPASISLANLNSTEFSFRYILPDNSQPVPNVVFIWKVDALGNKEYVIANSGYIQDWTRESGLQTFNIFSLTRDMYQQQYEYDPNQAVLQAVVGMTFVYGGLNEYYVDDPIYLEIFLIEPEDQEGNYLLSDSAISISNSLRIEITP